MLTSTCKGDSNLDRPKCLYSMRQTHRFQTFKEALHFLMNDFQFSNQEATHFIWDNQFRMGTDRAIWITEPTN